MCKTCGCSGSHSHRPFEPVTSRISIETDLLAKNDRLAGSLRARFERGRVGAVNLIGSPGAGKTTLIEKTIGQMRDVPIAVIEGDQATDRDARRIAATGARVRQVNTDAGCHLDADMIARAADELDVAARSLLVIENVGNLVCPALFDLGERAKVVVISLTEGDDKPLKYPHVFRAATVMVLTKMDLAPHLDVEPSRYVEHARQINPRITVFPVSATLGYGMDEWCGWLRTQVGDAR
ncbi:MAG TPA: hydrogenase nickel incorporation protein HypB [Kofleriaceae bacterium]|jgi:hydrogenase nickel incorporation protein HypB|nr:hydrogenase nickel incorporation protein HypB [Kofleriaceae bacterium]